MSVFPNIHPYQPSPFLGLKSGQGGSSFDPLTDLPNLSAAYPLLDGTYIYARTAAQFTIANTEYLSHAGNAALRGQSGTGGWTRWGWVYFDAISGTQTIISCTSASTVGMRVYLNGAAQRMSVQAGTGSGDTTATMDLVLSPNTWYFWIAEYDGTTLSLEINRGTPGTNSLATYSPGTNTFQVGRHATSNYLGGRLQGIGGCDGTLTSGEKDAIYNSGNGVLYADLPSTVKTKIASAGFFYNLTEQSGNRADSGGGGYTLTDNNTVTDNDGKVGYLVTADGQKVWKVVDPIGSFDLTQTDQTKKPLYKTGILNGKACLRGDGVNDLLQKTTGAIATQPFSIWAVIDDNDAGARTYCDGGVASKALMRHDGTNFEINAGLDVGAAHTAGAPHQYQGDYSGASSETFVDNASAATGDAGAQEEDSGLTLFALNDGTAPLAGDIFYLLVNDALLTSAERTSLDTYAADQWGI